MFGLRPFNLLPMQRQEERLQGMSGIRRLKKIYIHDELNSQGYLRSKKTPKKHNAHKIVIGYAKRMRKEPTPSEFRFKEILCRLKINHHFQYPFFISKGLSFIVDFYLPHKRLAIEIDGGYHHTNQQIMKDQFRSKKLKEIGIKVIRFTNNYIFDSPREIEELLSKDLTNVS
jgi:very-short-patch-repair endonuclease